MRRLACLGIGLVGRVGRGVVQLVEGFARFGEAVGFVVAQDKCVFGVGVGSSVGMWELRMFVLVELGFEAGRLGSGGLAFAGPVCSPQPSLAWVPKLCLPEFLGQTQSWVRKNWALLELIELVYLPFWQ
jgi:hypothetical protein